MSRAIWELYKKGGGGPGQQGGDDIFPYVYPILQFFRICKITNTFYMSPKFVAVKTILTQTFQCKLCFEKKRQLWALVSDPAQDSKRKKMPSRARQSRIFLARLHP